MERAREAPAGATAPSRPPRAGPARVDSRTKRLIPRLRAGDIAVIDHQDLDGLCAANLAERKPAAVVNISPSISGRYPNRGPLVLLRAGIPLMDLTDSRGLAGIREGQRVELDDQGLKVDGVRMAGSWLTTEAVEAAQEEARRYMGAEIEAFARNTLEYIERERNLVLDTPDIPPLTTDMNNRHVVVVVRGEGFKRDLEAILPYIREVRPILIAVDGGADALLEHDLKPHLIVGDMDSVSDQALRSGAEIVVHSYPRSRVAPTVETTDGAIPAPPAEPNAEAERLAASPGLARLESLGLEGHLFSVAGTSEDMAMLIAYERGAELIVAVGTHFSLVDFLDKGRAGMASTFLVRLRVGSRLVDARGVGALYGASPGMGYTWLLLLAAAVPVAAMFWGFPGLRGWLSLAQLQLMHWLKLHGL